MSDRRHRARRSTLGLRSPYRSSSSLHGKALAASARRNGFGDVTVHRAGFPFFDLYRLVVIARGRRLIDDVEQSKDALGDGTSGAALRFFNRIFRYNLDSSPFGWQLLAVARRSEDLAS